VVRKVDERVSVTAAESRNAAAPPRGRLVLGAALFVAGQLSPLLIPIVRGLDLTGVWKNVLTVLVLIAPELGILAAVAVMGKAGFDWLTGRVEAALGRFMQRHGPPDRVGPLRYKIGLIMFVIPLLIGWAAPYAAHHLPGYQSHTLWYSLTGDLLLVASLFVLGGDFWDKLRALFIHDATARLPEGA
jgi:hypothetical protein